MFRILSNIELAPNIFEMVVEHPRLAAKAAPGHFVIVMTDDSGERIPLTIADFDRQNGTITLVIMAIGVSTMKLVSLKAGAELYALIGPLGAASEIDDYGTVIMVAGGVGTAPVFPIARGLRDKGNKVISIQGARTKELLFWTEKLAAVSDTHIITTDDGSAGRKGLVTEPLRELLEGGASGDGKNKIGCAYMIGPAIMMKFCSQVVAPFGVKSVASLNSIMIDGTGMCGGCRVKVGKETKFTCVDGPEFDASQIDWDILLSRQKMYCEEEKCSLQKYKNTNETA
ncbi:MAG: sulfide/dihydroorotate dehydrogenase-like FAD/NAD-binding protein [Planctomycetaceae bacterium]|jgi:ferredoxin--NADP+ reductase|nr:sulfide/dihydroorotate dehydrogenase-like FAD/NAD-binding protein [Planctomycetaceae bacterium]